MEKIFKTFRIDDFECMYKWECALCVCVCVCLCHLLLVLICTYLGAHLELLYGIGNDAGGLWYCSACNARCQLLCRRDLGLGDALPSGWYLHAHSEIGNREEEHSNEHEPRADDGNNTTHNSRSACVAFPRSLLYCDNYHRRDRWLRAASYVAFAHSYIQQLLRYMCAPCAVRQVNIRRTHKWKL